MSGSTVPVSFFRRPIDVRDLLLTFGLHGSCDAAFFFTVYDPRTVMH
jgi:hypothetical protein